MKAPVLSERIVACRGMAGDLLGLVAFVLYAASFFLPAAGDLIGCQAFVYSLVLGAFVPMWAANPVFWVGLAQLSLGRYRAAGEAGWVGLLLALSECWLFIGDLRVGYFAWAGSMAVLAAAFWCGDTEEPRPRWPVQVGSSIAGEAARIACRFPQPTRALTTEQPGAGKEWPTTHPGKARRRA